MRRKRIGSYAHLLAIETVVRSAHRPDEAMLPENIFENPLCR